MRAAVLAIVAFGVLHVGCAARDARRDPGQTTVVLLTNEDGTTGSARVSNASGAAALAKPREAADVAAGQAPQPTRIMDDAEVQKVFGDALAALPLPPLRVVLRFQFDSDSLTEESRKELPALVRQIRERPAPDVVVVGHTDTVGDGDLNQQLGQRRADAVRRILVDAGVNSDLIESRSHGEADPQVRTPDETPEPANRRVEITLR
jgi:outer membrane protein OmpA-like peptidoglycan-associated protein